MGHYIVPVANLSTLSLSHTQCCLYSISLVNSYGRNVGHTIKSGRGEGGEGVKIIIMHRSTLYSKRDVMSVGDSR